MILIKSDNITGRVRDVTALLILLSTSTLQQVSSSKLGNRALVGRQDCFIENGYQGCLNPSINCEESCATKWEKSGCTEVGFTIYQNCVNQCACKKYACLCKRPGGELFVTVRVKIISTPINA